MMKKVKKLLRWFLGIIDSDRDLRMEAERIRFALEMLDKAPYYEDDIVNTLTGEDENAE